MSGKKLCIGMIYLTFSIQLIACDDQGGDSKPPTVETLSYYQDTKPIIDKHCATCHQPGQIAPFSLTNYTEVSGWLSSMRYALEDGIMPPWPAAEDCQKFVSNVPLSPENRATLLQWIEEGGVEGDPSRPALSEVPPQTSISRVDLSLAMPDFYEPLTSPDDYRCFVLEWPYQETKYISGFQAVPGNRRVVHHIAVYLIPPSLADDARERDADDPRMGYECFGGPNINDDPLSPFVLVGIWGPGHTILDYPAGTGLRVDPGSVLVLQMHYSILETLEKDLTEIQFKLDDQVEREAAMLPFLNLEWVAQQTMVIPEGEDNVLHSYSNDVTANPIYTVYTNGVILPNVPFEIFNVNLHMHTRGKSTVTKILRADGTEDCLLDLPRWDFHWQYVYQMAQSAIFWPGDELYLECVWDNTPGNQPWFNGQQLASVDLNWGEGTTEEMCVGTYFVARYEQ